MKLDETVCRGTLLIHCGQSYVVIGRSENYHKGLVTYRGWPIMLTKDVESGIVDCRWHVAENEEVEMFFPGVAFELPEYIK